MEKASTVVDNPELIHASLAFGWMAQSDLESTRNFPHQLFVVHTLSLSICQGLTSQLEREAHYDRQLREAMNSLVAAKLAMLRFDLEDTILLERQVLISLTTTPVFCDAMIRGMVALRKFGQPYRNSRLIPLWAAYLGPNDPLPCRELWGKVRDVYEGKEVELF